MSGLGQEFEDVLSESSADSDDLPELEDAVEAAGDEPEDESAESEKSGRTPENVRREVLRKQEQDLARLEGKINQRLDSLISEIRSVKQPSTPAVPSLDQYSVDHLRAERKNIPAEKIEAYDAYLMDRIVRESVDEKLTSAMSQQREIETRREAARKAQQRFPDLRNKNSEFFQAVEQKLNERGPEYKRSNPFAVLDVARDVAETMGIPSARRTRTPDTPAGTRNQGRRPAPAQSADSDVNAHKPPKEEVERVIARLKHTLPGKKFDVEALRTRIAEYRMNQHHLRERIRVSKVKE